MSTCLPALRLRPLGDGDAEVVAAAQRAMAADDFTFALGWSEAMPWSDYLLALDRLRRAIDVPADLVPAVFLVAEVEGQVVGRSSIRFELNDHLLHEGGHIGYGVLPNHRRRGHATEILRQSLVVARAAGVERALLTCDDGNMPSRAVIERCGGVLEDVVESRQGRGPVRRYWID